MVKLSVVIKSYHFEELILFLQPLLRWQQRTALIQNHDLWCTWKLPLLGGLLLYKSLLHVWPTSLLNLPSSYAFSFLEHGHYFNLPSSIEYVHFVFCKSCQLLPRPNPSVPRARISVLLPDMLGPVAIAPQDSSWTCEKTASAGSNLKR